MADEVETARLRSEVLKSFSQVGKRFQGGRSQLSGGGPLFGSDFRARKQIDLTTDSLTTDNYKIIPR